MAATVLIVDDDRFTRSVLEALFARDRAFQNAGVTVVVADDGESGLEAFRAHQPRVVITDLLMPKCDGFDLCRAIRAEPGAVAVELLVSSGVYRDAAIKEQLEREVGATFFAKPYQLRELADEVARRLGIDRPRSPKRRRPTPMAPGQHRGGSLADRPFPRLLLQLLDERATGRLVLRRGTVEKTAVLVLGHPINATTNVRDETLGHFLVARGVISDAQHRQALQAAAAGGIRIGQALIDSGAITSERLVELLAAQTRHKLVQSLRWPDGTWTFLPTPEPTTGGAPLDVEHLVVAGLKQTAVRDEALAAADRIRGIRLHLTERGKHLEPRLERLLGAAFAAVWTDGITVDQMAKLAGDREEIAAAVDALRRAELVREGAMTAAAAAAIRTRPELGDGEAVPSLADLSEQSQIRQYALPASGTDDLAGLLFDDLAEVTRRGARPLDLHPEDVDAVPQELDSGRDSGVIDVGELGLGARGSGPTESDQARRMLLEEYLRIQGMDHYEILQIPRDADVATIASALTARRLKYSPEWLSRYDLGRDYARLEELHRAYEQARRTLLDDEHRRVYDAELEGAELSTSAPSLAAEVAFRAACELLTRGEHAAAIEHLQAAIEQAPNEADYHAELGWATFLAGSRTPIAADAARPHLNHALRLAPEHGRAHEYKGIIAVAVGTDDVEAIAHLERGLAADPGRAEALDALEAARRRRGQLRPLERNYRVLLHRCGGEGSAVALALWRRLAVLYVELDDIENARVAYESALHIAPEDPALRDALMDVRGGAADGFHEHIGQLRRAWRAEPTARGPGCDMFRAALGAGRHDAAFLAAAALVTRELAPPDAVAYYRRYRPTFVVRAQRSLDDTLWRQLQHPDDSAEVSALFDILAPVYARLVPLDRSELEVDEHSRVAREELPARFVRQASYVAGLLGVPEPQVYVRSDFGGQIHVAALDPPVLLVGDDVLAGPEPFELGFRLGRAMTYLRPGRALGGARPGTQLKAGMLAALKSTMPDSHIDDPSGLVGALATEIRTLEEPSRRALHAIVISIARRSRSVNLSAWGRALSRTADRAGVLVAGDLPAVARFARVAGGAEAADELIDFFVSADHIILRSALGLSVDV